MIRIKVRVDLPKYVIIPKPVMNEMGHIIRDDVIAGIKAGKTLSKDSGRIKKNAPSTRRAKIARGQRPLSLIDRQHRFITPSTYLVRAGSNIVHVRLVDSVHEIYKSLTQRGYINWFGIGPRSAKKVLLLLRKTFNQIVVATRSKNIKKIK